MSVPCEGCYTNVVRGIIYKMPGGGYLCDECREALIIDEGEHYDEATETIKYGE
ncbi:hypothetical protein LCGC14_1595370 [marine sediment metagenome]|uniref:Uncharacterized protein n=1 Tax=marine sediment metagenome TaxID=412755 RepID=A0A0F9IZ36_9ZZZZ